MPRSSSASSENTKVTNMPNLKQGTLSFASVKRTGSTSNAKPQPKIPVTEKGGRRRVEAIAEARNGARPTDIFEISDEDGITAAETTAPIKRPRASLRARTSSGTTKPAPPHSLQSFEKPNPSPEEIGRQHLDAEDEASCYRKYYREVRSKTDHVEPIHSEGQNKIHQMLRFFDMSCEFGPCIGMTRLERWERAEALDLNPPVEVRDMLLTKEGVENADYAQCVLHGEV